MGAMTDNAPVPEGDSEPTTITELENALLLVRKTINEVDQMPPGARKAMVVSALYRALQEFTKELRDEREVALLDAAIELAQEGWPEKTKRETKFFEVTDERRIYHLEYGLKRLYRLNKMIVLDMPNGKTQILEPFTSDYEPARIAERMYKKVMAALRSQRDWETKFGKPATRRKYPKYEDK